ncbi:MAG: hypothetical protein ABIJ21_07310 [Nanoarchaeota archaeon]
MIKKDCPFHPIDIPEDREIVNTDDKTYQWKMDPKGYFLVKIQDGNICCGHVTPQHRITIEFRGKDPDKIIKEIAKRKLCDLSHMGYIAQELQIAKECLTTGKKYVQR